MYACLSAFVCLLGVGAVASFSLPSAAGSNGIDVYLNAHAGIPADVNEAMRRETDSLMRSSGYTVEWRQQPQEVSGTTLIVVVFHGNCDPRPSGTRRVGSRTLATASVQHGLVLPFIDIDCAALQQFLAPTLRKNPPRDTQVLYGRALGRLLAHELYHVVGQTVQHTASGVTQASVTATDLVSDNLAFGKTAIEKLHPALVIRNRRLPSKDEVR